MMTLRKIGWGFCTISVVIPVGVTFFDVFGHVACVEGVSMQPSINSLDLVWLNRWNARTYNFQRGDVVSLTDPNVVDDKIIKRIIGLEGDLVKTLTYKNRFVRVPDGHCWLEGDNHERSRDSNEYGPVALGLIHAKVSHIVWPPEHWRKMELSLPEDRINVDDSPTKEGDLDLKVNRFDTEESQDQLDSSQLNMASNLVITSFILFVVILLMRTE